MDKTFQMGVQGINYRDSSKCGTSYYARYLDEMNDRDDEPDLKDELYQYYNVAPRIKAPVFLIHGGRGKREIILEGK